MQAVVLHKVAFLEYFCPKQGQDFKPLAVPLYPNMGQVPPRDKLMLSTPEHAPAYMMAANDGVIKAIVSFYRVNSDRAFERHRSRILINDLNTAHALKKLLIQFLGLKELTLTYGLGDFDSHFFPLECGTAGLREH